MGNVVSGNKDKKTKKISVVDTGKKEKHFKDPTQSWWGKVLIWVLVVGMVLGIIISLILGIVNA
jgi:hypothetical protein